jgi:hypothetical protein
MKHVEKKLKLIMMQLLLEIRIKLPKPKKLFEKQLEMRNGEKLRNLLRGTGKNLKISKIQIKLRISRKKLQTL